MAHPPLLKPSMFSGFWYTSVLLGWGLLVVACVQVGTASITAAGLPLLMSAVLLLVLELLPLVQGRGHDPHGVVMSTAFVCAVLFMWGPWPAIVMVSIAAMASDLRAGKHWWKVLFNVGQYACSVAAGAVVIWLAGQHPSLQHPLPRFSVSDIGWVVGVWVVYFTVNLVLVSGVLAHRSSLRSELFDDFLHYSMMNFAVLGISPIIVVVAQNVWPLLPALLIPLLLLYRMAQMTLEKEHEAGHDALTELPNRSSMHFALNDHLSHARRTGDTFGLLLIDLDHFKEVNDSLGHHAGDELLVHFAHCLRRSVRPQDYVTRLGGDEFAVIIPAADERAARDVAERIRDSLIEPVYVQGMQLQIEASIGLAMHPEHGEGLEDLLRHADSAMYTAKESREGIALYSAVRDRNSTDRLSLLAELRQALDQHTLELHYQPKVSLADRGLLGVEALIRWDHPTRGFIAPDYFIPLAEQSGLMPMLTAQVIEIAVAQLRDWSELGLQVPMAVNISPTDLTGHRLTHLLAQTTTTHGVAAGMLKLEITERVVAEETEEMNSVLLTLHEMGVTLSLDDFGTGYSSMRRLKTLPISELKIDRSFVSSLFDSTADVGIVRAVIDLAHALGMPAIAEGVETESEWQLLHSLGCDGAQGWHIARPMPAADITEWITAHAPSSLRTDAA
ncbi:diguanylate cyclase (GGDEF)-like protein [Jatrophihabitans sp. GAS493]|uniref:putative bifunctional diguanylate cyclase/phosphodiesterase n=1 Tax=Jatrophihabitans sp. GAS493 TaxID=1907575 RepID=UPI000BB797BE|nr:EAL domain-containing protein [Jatrophihabitans sp. GAS493]SOD73586.1 diguanylate cyclase (GGDEF)-like protein [Jatrophihabitans sp. GAS493]